MRPQGLVRTTFFAVRVIGGRIATCSGVRPKLFEECRLVINLEPALVISGRVQNESGVIHVMADQIEAMPALGLPDQESHDFR